MLTRLVFADFEKKLTSNHSQKKSKNRQRLYFNDPFHKALHIISVKREAFAKISLCEY